MLIRDVMMMMMIVVMMVIVDSDCGDDGDSG